MTMIDDCKTITIYYVLHIYAVYDCMPSARLGGALKYDGYCFRANTRINRAAATRIPSTQ